MYKTKIRIRTIEEAKEFANICLKQKPIMTLESGRFKVDAKSILGIFSLNLSKDVDLVITGTDDFSVIEKILKDIKKFIV